MVLSDIWKCHRRLDAHCIQITLQLNPVGMFIIGLAPSHPYLWSNHNQCPEGSKYTHAKPLYITSQIHTNYLPFFPSYIFLFHVLFTFSVCYPYFIAWFVLSFLLNCFCFVQKWIRCLYYRTGHCFAKALKQNVKLHIHFVVLKQLVLAKQEKYCIQNCEKASSK